MNRHRPSHAAVFAAALLACTSAASASDVALPSGARLDLQPEAAPAPAAEAPLRDAAQPPPRFGAAGTWWWALGGSFADDLDSNQDFGIYGSIRYFIAEDWEFGGQLNLRYIKQEGEDVFGINPVMVIRYHFYKTENWTVFADAGIGVMGSTDTVPEGSTSFNFTPRVGVGVTRQIDDSGTRLEAGLTWMHISNARIKGDRNNESRDAPQVYIGVVFPL